MTRITACLALVCAGLTAITTAADEPAPGHSGITVDAQGQLVSIDPARRAELVAQLRASLAASGTRAESGPVRRRADGTQAMTLGAEHTAFVVAVAADDETLAVQCVLGVEAAANVLATDDAK